MATTANSDVFDELPGLRERLTPPRPTRGRRIDISTPLHQLFAERYYNGRDLKVILTSKDSQTGTGKTTLAFWLADQWQQLFGDEFWSAERNATMDVNDYLAKYRELSPGSVLLLDEAESLDARRSMASENVDFSHDWMEMRVRQVSTILTLPTRTALDSRLQELSDVWIDVERRGKALVHDIRVGRYDSQVRSWQSHWIEWPNVADHPEMKALDKMKQERIDRKLQSRQTGEDPEPPDPDEIRREERIAISQRARERGMTLREIGEMVDMSRQWVSNNTDVDST
jgi:hypothetical protein